MEYYKDKSVAAYLQDLSAKLAAPGGGSAAALSAAMGACLLSMVVNFTLGKKKYARYEKELARVLEKSEKLRKDFLELVDLDVAAYKSGEARKALDVPFALCRLSYEAIKLCPLLIKKSNPNLASDVAVAAILLESAFACAEFNVRINLKIIGEKKLSAGINRELSAKYIAVAKTRKKTEAGVGKIIGR